MNPIRLARSLYKIGLGFIAFDQGHDAALSKRFDRARDYINGKTNFHNNLLVSTKVQPHPNLKVTYKVMVTGCPFVLDIFGIVFIFNLEEAPIIEPDTQLVEQGFQKFLLSKNLTTIAHKEFQVL